MTTFQEELLNAIEEISMNTGMKLKDIIEQALELIEMQKKGGKMSGYRK